MTRRTLWNLRMLNGTLGLHLFNTSKSLTETSIPPVFIACEAPSSHYQNKSRIEENLPMQLPNFVDLSAGQWLLLWFRWLIRAEASRLVSLKKVAVGNKFKNCIDLRIRRSTGEWHYQWFWNDELRLAVAITKGQKQAHPTEFDPST